MYIRQCGVTNEDVYIYVTLLIALFLVETEAQHKNVSLAKERVKVVPLRKGAVFRLFKDFIQ